MAALKAAGSRGITAIRKGGVNAIQMELGCRGYMAEPEPPTPENWPGPISPSPSILPTLKTIIESFLP